MASALVAGCGKKDNKDNNNSGNGDKQKTKVTLKVWGAQEEQEILAEMIKSFKEANPDKEYDISWCCK